MPDFPPDTATPAHEFLEALRAGDAARASALLDAHPAIAGANIHTAAALADARGVDAYLAADRRAATAPFAPTGIPPLLYALASEFQTVRGIAATARLAVVRRLLDAGANANTAVQLGNDPNARIPALYFACIVNDAPVAALLLEHGANPNDGESVFHAAERDHRACLDILLAHGADLSRAHQHWGNTPLYFLAGLREDNPLTPAATRGMQWLLEHGADPNVPSTPSPTTPDAPGADETPLHRIAGRRTVPVAELLVAHGADVNRPRRDGRTPYAMAIRAGNIPMAEYLVRVGALTTSLAPIDALLGACAQADRASAADIVATSPGVMTSLTLEDQRALFDIMMERGESAARVMLELGWPTTAESEWGGTALHWAAWHGRRELVQLLLAHQAPVNVRDSTYGSSPIAWACHGAVNARKAPEHEYIAIVHQLLDAGATRAESFNAWGEPPERLATPALAAVLAERGFTA